MTKENVPASEVMHFPNTFRYPNGWGIPTLPVRQRDAGTEPHHQAAVVRDCGKGRAHQGYHLEKHRSRAWARLRT